MSNLDWSRWSDFSESEFACSHCGEVHMDPEFMDKMQALRDRIGRIVVSSGYRCPEYNQRISSTGANGPHTTGRAVDVLAGTRKAYHILEDALDLGFTGIGISQREGSRFLHLDTLEDSPRPNVWTYS